MCIPIISANITARHLGDPIRTWALPRYQATYPDGQDACPSDSMGGIQRDVNGSVFGATAVRVDFVLYAEWDAWRMRKNNWIRILSISI